MTPAAYLTARVLYWGRGLRTDSAEYGFLLSDETVPRVLFFNAGHLSPDGLPPKVGMAAKFAFTSGSDSKATFQVTLEPTEPLTPQQSVISTLALARVVEVQPDSARLVTLPGCSANLRWGSDDVVELQVGDYVRCRLIESDDCGLKEPLAFDAVRIDFSDPKEQACLAAYLQHSTKRPRRNRKSKWASLMEVREGFIYDSNKNELRLPGRKPVGIPPQFCGVLCRLVARNPGGEGWQGTITYTEMAELFERGKLEKKEVEFDELEERILKLGDELKQNAVKRAQECVRQLSRWLRRRRISPESFLIAEPQFKRYRLGEGWRKKPVIGGAEAPSSYADISSWE